MALIQDLINAEVLDRRVRLRRPAPLVPRALPPRDGPAALSLPYSAPGLTWRGLKAIDPQAVGQALRAGVHLRPDDGTPPVFDELADTRGPGPARRGARRSHPCARRWRRGAPPSWSSIAQAPWRWSAWRAGPAAACRSGCAPSSGDYAASIRCAFGDAVAVNEDAGPAFMEILFGHSEEPHQVLRLTSLVDGPAGRSLPGAPRSSPVSATACWATSTGCIDEVRRFDAIPRARRRRGRWPSRSMSPASPSSTSSSSGWRSSARALGLAAR